MQCKLLSEIINGDINLSTCQNEVGRVFVGLQDFVEKRVEKSNEGENEVIGWGVKQNFTITFNEIQARLNQPIEHVGHLHKLQLTMFNDINFKSVNSGKVINAHVITIYS